MKYGTEAQKQHYLPRLAKGVDIPCFALTSPQAGSDAASMPDRGVVCGCSGIWLGITEWRGYSQFMALLGRWLGITEWRGLRAVYGTALGYG
jgi:hypothetical protein